MKMSSAETKRVVNNYMKENRTLNAEIEMFPGLVVYEDTVQDAYDELMLAKIDWLNALLED